MIRDLNCLHLRIFRTRPNDRKLLAGLRLYLRLALAESSIAVSPLLFFFFGRLSGAGISDSLKYNKIIMVLLPVPETFKAFTPKLLT